MWARHGGLTCDLTIKCWKTRTTLMSRSWFPGTDSNNVKCDRWSTSKVCYITMMFRCVSPVIFQSCRLDQMCLEYCNIEKCFGPLWVFCLCGFFLWGEIPWKLQWSVVGESTEKKEEENGGVLQQLTFEALKWQKQPHNERCGDVMSYIFISKKELFLFTVFVYGNGRWVEMITSWFHLWLVIKAFIASGSGTE